MPVDTAAAVRDTIVAVFRQRVYDRTTTVSLASRIWAYLWSALASGIRAVYHSPPGRWTVGGVLVAVLVVLVARAILGGLVPGASDTMRRTRTGSAAGDATDPWARAQRLAAAGRYTDAAHELYRALLVSVAARAPLRLHPSKTAGDYARDLRRAAPASFAPFREFARDYEVVVYGYRACDRSRFERLAALAARLDPRFAGPVRE